MADADEKPTVGHGDRGESPGAARTPGGLGKRHDGAALPPPPPPETETDRVEEVDRETERRVLRKLDVRIIPICVWIYLLNMMDRVSIGNGRLFGLEEDLGLEGDQFQLAVGVLFVTYCLFEVPSNMIIKRLQPARYLAGLVLAWGVAATLTAWVTNLAGLVACRLLLGLFEAGLVPGVVLYFTMFYGKRSIATRLSYFFAASAFSGVAGGLVAYGVGAGLDGSLGWRAWRWIVLINGAPTVLTGFAVPFLLPNSPSTAAFLTEGEKEALALMRERELGGRARNADELDWADVRDGFRDPTLWLFCVTHYSLSNMLYSFSVFLPSIIRGLGRWDSAQAQALTAPVYAAGAATYLVNARLSDRTQRRGAFAAGAMATSICGYALLVAGAGTAASYAGCFLVAMGLYSVGGIMVAWVMVNNPRYGKRAITSGMQLTVGNVAGVASSYMFESKHAPTFYPGYGVTIGLLVLGLACIVALHCIFRWENRRRARGELDWLVEGRTEEDVVELGERSPYFRFTV
ncbi:hypothetical protein RB595_000287 [Gaeumannomyces hyphopodioides]